MKRNTIPIAGIFLACVIAAGIPAVAAADLAKATATPIINPVPVATPAADQLQTPAAKINTPPVNTTPSKNPDKTTPVKIADKNADVQNTTAKNWWENLWPFATVKTADDTTSPEQAQKTAAPAVTSPPADTAKDIVKDNTSPKGIADDKKNSRNV